MTIKVRARLLREPDLSLNKAKDLCRAAEIAGLQMKMMKEEVENETVRTVQAEGLIKDCQYCGNTHQRRKCPAYGNICKKCTRKNHFASVCRSKKVNNVEDEPKDEEEVCMVNEDGKDQFFCGLGR